MSDLKKLVAQFMSELAKFEATTAQAPIAADEFSPEELADLTKVRNMGAKIRAKIAATAKPNAEIPKLEAVPFPQPEDSPQMTEAGNDGVQTRGGGGKTKPKKEEHIVANLLKSETHLWKMNIEGGLPETITFECAGDKKAVPVILGEEEPKIWKNVYAPAFFSKKDGFTSVVATVTGRTKAQQPFTQTHKYDIPNKGMSIDLTVEIRWFGDGEKEFAILVNGASNDEYGGKPSYWGINLLEKIKDETGADFSDSHTPSAEFIDGEPGCALCLGDMDATPSGRAEKGVAKAKSEAFGIFDKLKRDPNSGKIIQKIQMYTHSKGSAFGDGYIDELKRQAQIYHKKHDNIFADINHLIDIVIDLDAHQSPHIHKEKDTYPNIAVAHGNGIADANQTGDVIGFDRLGRTEPATLLGGHGNDSFTSELDIILDQHNKNEFSKNSDKYEGFDRNLFAANDKKDDIVTDVIIGGQEQEKPKDKDPNKHNGMGGHAGRTPKYPANKNK